MSPASQWAPAAGDTQSTPSQQLDSAVASSGILRATSRIRLNPTNACPTRNAMGGVGETLLSTEAIAARVTALGEEVSDAYRGMRPVLVVVLKGSFVFAADLSRAIRTEHEVEFMRARSYAGTASSGSVEVTGLERAELVGRHVLVVEDIVDTGLTLKGIIEEMRGMGAESVKTCSFLRKTTERRRENTPEIDFVAFDIPDKFIVGYGLDLDQRWRHLPYVAVYNPE